MNFINRALASIKRKPGKSLILLVLVFILGAVIAGAVSISQAVVNTESNLRRSLPPVVTVMESWEEGELIFHQTGEWPEYRLTPEMMRELSNLPQVQNFDYSLSFNLLNIRGFVQYEPDTDQPQGWVDEDHGLDLRLRGVSNAAILDASQGLIQVTDGRTFTQEEIQTAGPVIPVVMSRGFAEANGLSVGSTFEPTFQIFPMDPDDMFWGGVDRDADPLVDETFLMEVIGLYELGPNGPVAENEHDFNARWLVFELMNRFYIPNVQIEVMDRIANEGWRMQLEDLDGDILFNPGDMPPHFENIFVLYDLNDADEFRELAGGILPPNFIIRDLSTAFAQISSSMESMLYIANIVLWVAVGATLIILSLLITLFLRDRKHEIGIYLALGERRGGIISQILVEVLSVSIIGITLSLFAGNIISEAISSQMLRNTMMADLESGHHAPEWNPLDGLGYGVNLSMDEMLESYQVSLDGRTIAFFYLVGSATVVLSTISPILYVTSLNPKKILM